MLILLTLMQVKYKTVFPTHGIGLWGIIWEITNGNVCASVERGLSWEQIIIKAEAPESLMWQICTEFHTDVPLVSWATAQAQQLAQGHLTAVCMPETKLKKFLDLHEDCIYLNSKLFEFVFFLLWSKNLNA